MLGNLGDWLHDSFLSDFNVCFHLGITSNKFYINIISYLRA